MRSHIVALALISAMPLAALAAEKAAAKKPATISVGEFAKMLAVTAANGRAVDTRAETEALVSRGVPLGDLSAPLSERKLAQILDFYGVKVKATDSSLGVSARKAEAALALIGSAVSTGRGAPETGASVAPAPQTLDDCAKLKNPGMCVNCCKDLGLAANSCHRTCYQIHKEPSPSEPLP